MSRETFTIGKRLVARGPSATQEKPDIDGTILGERDDGRVLVQEERYNTPTVVNPNGGWVTIEAFKADCLEKAA